MRSPETSPRLPAVIGSLLLLALPFVLSPPGVGAATATLDSIRVSPLEPTVCDSVTIGVTGTLSSPCLEIVGAEIVGPIPPPPDCAAIICPARFEIRIKVQEPGLPTPCPTVATPYALRFPVGLLPAGAYSVRAVEENVLSPVVSATVDSSVVWGTFFVRSSPTCPPGTGCYIFAFGPPPESIPLPGFCTTTVPPGGTATFDLLFHNESPVGGMQTRVAIYDPRLDVSAYGPIPLGLFTPKSVEAVGRARGFQLDWVPEGDALKAILYSTTGASIPPGDGPIMRIAYGVSADVREDTYVIWHFDEVVSDPEGNLIPPCPTLRETSGELCVVGASCDVNGDGASDIRDIIRIVRCALAGTGTEACPDSIATRADCNGDGGVDVRDVICCVRKILAFRLDSIDPVGSTPAPGPGTSVSFLGDVAWTTPVEGRVRLRVAPQGGVAGVEWMIRPSAPGARVRDLRVVSGGEGVHFEWSSDGTGRAYAMLYSETGAAIGHDVVLELAVDRLMGGSEPASLHITDPLASGSDGAPETVSSVKAAAVMPAGGISAPAVYPARPNPFVSESEITFALPQAGRAELRVYDVRGRLVRTLVDGERPAGVYHERWDGRTGDGRAVSSGIYLIRFRAGGVAQTQRLLRLR